ncbi:hypothetical protein SAMN03159341_12848 [Paenibacillus sp. 1_12]|uniref:hypothetical protein n=1 Tax=Paenibacillus sp. 1_12 TaxID=1566278 RepID=UPI0008E712F6|nr:hypothetical protein [Paenibacillus sp. 1_12]SFM36349.1 hypothetical protein SAMN03159341_12848 [Paenibacillus sp. 1_12]
MIKIKKINKKTKFILVTFIVFITIYFCLDKFIIINNTETTYGIYDFGKTSIDAELKVKGTGKQMIDGEIVSTMVEVLEIKNIQKDLNIKRGDEIKVNEYFKLFKNRYIYGIPFLPGRSVTGMGTNYKRLLNGEIGLVRIQYDRKYDKLWIEPYIIRIP